MKEKNSNNYTNIISKIDKDSDIQNILNSSNEDMIDSNDSIENKNYSESVVSGLTKLELDEENQLLDDSE